MLTIYTDGSCTPNPGKGGWGYIAIFPDCEISDSGSSSHTTNNIMEITAVIKPLQQFPNQDSYTIYTDSQYVINCATGKWKRKKNIELWEEYDKVSKNKKITYIWVKGHNGDPYNERVDKIAKNA
jgi:ribonuclease HI